MNLSDYALKVIFAVEKRRSIYLLLHESTT